MIIKDIYNFLKKFSNIISDEDKHKLVNIQSHLQFMNNSKPLKNKYGEHFKDCCWSDESTKCGPDTCFCSNLKRKTIMVEQEAKDLMKSYFTIYNLTKCNNCIFY